MNIIHEREHQSNIDKSNKHDENFICKHKHQSNVDKSIKKSRKKKQKKMLMVCTAMILDSFLIWIEALGDFN